MNLKKFKLEVKRLPHIHRPDGRPVQIYDILADWLRRMVEAKAADPGGKVYPLALTEEEFQAVRVYFLQFAYDAAISEEMDPLRNIMDILDIKLPEIEDLDDEPE